MSPHAVKREREIEAAVLRAFDLALAAGDDAACDLCTNALTGDQRAKLDCLRTLGALI